METRPIEDYVFWTTPTFRRTGAPVNELAGWRCDVYLKERVDDDEELGEPIGEGTGATPEDAFADGLGVARTGDGSRDAEDGLPFECFAGGEDGDNDDEAVPDA